MRKSFLLLLSLGLVTTGCSSLEQNMYNKYTNCVKEKSYLHGGKEGTITHPHGSERIEYCKSKYMFDTGQDD